ncbi:MAG TPA: hypothetical protein VHZ52_05315 [Acidobacteriaceae bacterium]|jgi:hypothetical protein|nr:hypothetical protein [Acidobacteriaceae bacterium]
MRIVKLETAVAVLLLGLSAQAQMKRTSVPLGNAIDKALDKSSILAGDVRPFHIRITIDEPENAQSPYQGSIEEWWVSKDQWRREVTDKEGLRQTIVAANGSVTENDEGDYFPLWLRCFVTAVFDPIPDADTVRKSNAMIEQITMPNGAKSAPNVRFQFKIGTGARATDAFENISFDGEGRLEFYGNPRYDMEFHDYRGFGKKQIARELVHNPEPGTKLVGKVVVLEDESKAGQDAGRYTPLPTTDDRFRSFAVSSQQLEAFTAGDTPIDWPGVRSGNTSGHLAMYISVDSEGQVREAWPLNSDNAGLEDPARAQIRKWKIKGPVDKDGKPVQIDGGLGFVFQSKIENPLPIMTGREEIERQIIQCNYNPILPKGALPSGQSFKIRVGINEHGEETGESFPEVPESAIQAAHFEPHRCRFKPYVVNGQPTYYGIEFLFTAP